MGRDTRIVGKEALASTSISSFPDADTVGELRSMYSDCITSSPFTQTKWISYGTVGNKGEIIPEVFLKITQFDFSKRGGRDEA